MSLLKKIKDKIILKNSSGSVLSPSLRPEELFTQMNPNQVGSLISSYIEQNGNIALKLVNEQTLHFCWLRQLGNLLEEFKIDLVIDGGANTGQYASTLLGYSGFRGEIHSYEPLTVEFNVLKSYENHYSNWSVFNLALGNFDGDADIHINGEVSSLLPSSKHLNDILRQSNERLTESVKVRRIDTLYKDILEGEARRLMLKLDVQGFEKQALDSAAEYLKYFKLIQIELSGLSLYLGDFRIDDAIKYMTEKGFVLIFVKNNFALKNNVTIDYDFIFCRQSELEERLSQSNG